MERIIKANSLFEIESILDNTVASLTSYELTDELIKKLDSKEISIEQINVKELHKIARNVAFQDENATEFLKSMFEILDSQSTNSNKNHIINISNNVILNLSQLREKGLTTDEKNRIILNSIENIREIIKLSSLS